MRIVFSAAAAILVLGLCHTAVAYSPPQRLTPTNLTSYPFVSIKAQDGSEGCKRFVVTVTPRQRVEPRRFVGDLSVYSNGRLVTRCAVPIHRLSPQSKDVLEPEKMQSDVLTFEVSSANLEGSTFRLTQYHPGEAVWSGEWVGFEEYWFYLKDFAHVAGTDEYLWGEAVGGFQMATSLDETNGILHCWIRNGATNAVAYNDFYFGYSAHIRLEIRQGAEWVRVGAEVFPGGNVVRGAVPTNTKVRWLQPGQIITNTWMRRDSFERRKFQKATARETLLPGICEGDTFALDLVAARWWAYDILRRRRLEARVRQTFYSASPDDLYPYTHGPEITLYSPVFSLDIAAIAAALPERPALAATPTNRVSGTNSFVAISVAHENYVFEAVTPFPLLTNRFFLNQDGHTTFQESTSSGGAAICIRPEKIEEAEHAIECQPAEQDPQGNWGQSDHGYQISVRFAKQSFILGEPITATVIFRNLTNVYLSAPVSMPRFDTQVLVTNQKGEPLRPKEEEASGLSEFQKKLRNLIQDPKYFSVMPRAQVKLQVNVNDLFDLTAPEVYHVQIRYSNLAQSGFGEVHSDSATIRIVPP